MVVFRTESVPIRMNVSRESDRLSPFLPSMTDSGVQKPSWADLPSDLLQLISKRMIEIVDYVRFSAVCKSWHSVATPANLPSLAPWIMLPYFPSDTVRRFRSLSRIYKFDFPFFRGCVTYTSPFGWLLLVCRSLSLALFNPLTNVGIHLPPLPTFPEKSRLAPYIANLTRFGNWSNIAKNFKFHQFMSDAGEHIVALDARGVFLFCRVGDNAWTMPRHHCETVIAIDSIVYHKERFYIAYWNGEVANCELIPGAQITPLPSLKVPAKSTCCYLVDVAGELVLVTCPFVIDGAVDCDFYKLDTNGQVKWSKIHDIGSYTLFITIFKYICAIDAGKASGCKSNCLYICRRDRPLRFYKVSVEDGIVNTNPIFKEECSLDHVTSSWFKPTLC